VLLPVVLITAGTLFLLSNLGMISELNWSAALSLWPLLLVFVGLDILVVQFRPPLGTLLSALVTLVTIGVFGYVLLFGPPAAVTRALGSAANRELVDESFTIDSEGVDTAEITLELGDQSSRIGAGEEDAMLDFTIWTNTALDLQQVLDDDHLRVVVGERPGGFNFGTPLAIDANREWTFALNPTIPTELRLNAANGSVSADLSGLTLSDLGIDAANGAITAMLPDGDYDIGLDAGNGALVLTLPGSGTQEMQADTGNGSVRLLLPPGMAARVEYETGNGSLSVDERFERISGDEEEGVYETTGFDGATDSILLILDGGNGQIVITEP
jgi:hypothetical protein